MLFRSVNLTRLVEGDDYWVAQVFDSLWPLRPLLPDSVMAPGGGSPLGAEAGASETEAIPRESAIPAPISPTSIAAASKTLVPPSGDGVASAGSHVAAMARAGGAAPTDPTPAGAFQVIDVGTGGGFPGLAVDIALPQAHLTLVDSVGRKVEAVRAMAQALGLAERVSVRCERIEQTGQAKACRAQFDWALARAVASAPVVAEYLVPLIQPEGRALLYRGQWSKQDAEDLTKACVPLKATIEDCRPRQLPGDKGIRHALVLKPLAACPRSYPRAVGIPSKQPLGMPPPKPRPPSR